MSRVQVATMTYAARALATHDNREWKHAPDELEAQFGITGATQRHFETLHAAPLYPSAAYLLGKADNAHFYLRQWTGHSGEQLAPITVFELEFYTRGSKDSDWNTIRLGSEDGPRATLALELLAQNVERKLGVDRKDVESQALGLSAFISAMNDAFDLDL